MNMRDIIIAKRDKHSLTDEQIKFFVKGVTDGTIPDYQTSALLMAIVLNGMDDREMTTLTLEMAASGNQMKFPYLEGVPVDKHSTGGVGDKITPILIPLIATFGVETVKLSGRGLGFTGGTVDKFESIKGFNIEVSPKDFHMYVIQTGMVISGQTPDLAPADKILYALRDVTGTVDSIPLIASSIMSKKIAGGASAIALDVTCGSGAFMKDYGMAKELAEAMIRIGKLAERKTVAVITDMDQPLGRFCGNILEMQEVYNTVTGKGEEDVIAVVTELAFQLIKLAGKDAGMSDEVLRNEIRARLSDGTCYEKYKELIKSQGGEWNDMTGPVYVDKPFDCMHVNSPEAGYVTGMRADLIGQASVLLGAGRLAKTDSIDYGAGIGFFAKIGDKVERGDSLCALYQGENSTLPEERLFDAMDLILEAYEIGPEKPETKPAILDVIS
ncbi:thymidine phosphorylase [Butyrivibrio sp. AE2032]|uniref:thymidine phosphorylase n=1 Tax=Butyrivibrio sp. AE2032 TaxID=1458463 RepID=UPI00054CE565|nr:thymidine phosphorylase [Butyrivibrio sp. AE2032]